MMSLRELVDRYRSLAPRFSQPIALSRFGLSRADTERLFSAYDEDYHISRFFHFTQQSSDNPERAPASGASDSSPYSINGEPATHVALDADIESLL